MGAEGQIVGSGGGGDEAVGWVAVEGWRKLGAGDADLCCDGDYVGAWAAEDVGEPGVSRGGKFDSLALHGISHFKEGDGGDVDNVAVDEGTDLLLGSQG
jgi:hypothetical protein